MWRIVFCVCLCVSAVTSQSCGGRRELQGETGVIVSHQSVGKTVYQNNLDCTWSIRGGRGKAVLLSFEVFSLEKRYRRRCEDSLTVYDGGEGGREIKKLCGSNLPGDIYSSTGKNLTLKFKTDSGTTRKGFKVRYKLLDAGKPHSISISPDGDVVVGQRVHCSAQGFPQPEVWMEAFGETVKGPFNLSLDVPTTVEGQQEVKCIAWNMIGLDRKTKNINVNRKPHSISISPDEVDVGQRIRCSAKGRPQPKVMMETCGKTVNGTSAVSLVVPKTAEGQQKVTCIAWSSLGIERKTKSIYVNNKPHSINISPDEVVVGQKVKCSAQGYPWPEVWIEAFGKTVNGKSTVSLDVPATTKESQQKVTCIAWNRFSADMNTKNINVKNKPHSINISPDEVVVGQRVNCSAQGNPQPQVRMQAFGKTVNGKSAASLVVPATAWGPQEVKCIAWNSIGIDRKTKKINMPS